MLVAVTRHDNHAFESSPEGETHAETTKIVVSTMAAMRARLKPGTHDHRRQFCGPRILDEVFDTDM